MPSVNLQEYHCRTLEGIVIDTSGREGLRSGWKCRLEDNTHSQPTSYAEDIPIITSKIASTRIELQKRWTEQEVVIEDAQKGLLIDTFVLMINIEESKLVVGDAFDSLLVFTNVLEKYIKSESFNVGEVTTLDARSPWGNVFGWDMMFEQSEV